MDPDLQDLLSAYRGGADLDEPRRAELLARLRDDSAFRAAFVQEIRLLGMLKAVQSTEPRWLLLEDELGWSARDDSGAVLLEDRVMGHIEALPRRGTSRGWQLGALAAAALAAAFLVMWLRPRPEPAGPAAAPVTPPYVAVVVKLDGAVWEPSEQAPPSEGSPLATGQHRLRAGRVTLTFFNGVMLSLQGPADLDLISVERIFCQQGKLRARVPAGAQGFTVLAPGAAVVDLGTEFGLNVATEGKAELMVFEGKAEVSVLNAEGHTLSSELLNAAQAVEVDPGAGRIRDLAAAPEQFVAAPELIPPALVLGAGYADEIRKSRPLGYWRFESMADGLLPSELPGGPPLRSTGPVALAGAPGDNRCVVFGPTKAEQHLVMDGSWTPPRDTGHAVEAWALAEEFNAGTLFNLTSRVEERAQDHTLILELTGRSHHLVHDPCRVRYLDRWPPGRTGGVNVFSRGMYIPYRWHHLVAQKLRDRLELYMDGELVGSAPAEADEATLPCRVMVGRLKHGRQPTLDQIRQFVGRLDELAIYDHPLAAEEIRRHYELRTTDPEAAAR
jgi:hypothetical protein